MSQCDGMHGQVAAQRMMMIALTKLLDTHHLANATFDIDELELECDNRSLIMAIDELAGRVHFRVCETDDYERQATMMKRTLERGMEP